MVDHHAVGQASELLRCNFDVSKGEDNDFDSENLITFSLSKSLFSPSGIL